MFEDPAPSAKTYVGRATLWASGLAIVAAIVLVLRNLFLWFRDGLWPSYPAARMLADLGIPDPVLPWAWVQAVLDWTLGWSAAALLTWFAIVAFFFGANWIDDYHKQKEAAAAARAKFMPASQIRPAGDAGAAEPAKAEQVAAEETKSEAPLPERSFGYKLVSNLMATGCLLLIVAAIVGLFMGWGHLSRSHYDVVIARVHSVETSCVVSWSGRHPGVLPRESPEMPCAEARARAGARLVHEFRTVAYSYISPVDGRTYSGRLHAQSSDFPFDVRAGGEMAVYSLRADPSRSRRTLPLSFATPDVRREPSPAPPPADAVASQPWQTMELVWMGAALLLTLAAVTLLLFWLNSIPLKFQSDGHTYRVYSDGHFSDLLDNRITDPTQIATLTKASDAHLAALGGHRSSDNL